MPQTRPNKTKVIVNSDGYNLAQDLTAQADSSNVIIPVASDAERNGLAAAWPGGVLPVSTPVSRTDLPGNPLQIWTGSRWSWSRRLGKTRQANVTNAGTSFVTICTVTGATLGGVCEITYAGVLSNANSGVGRIADVQILQDGNLIGGIVSFALPLTITGAPSPSSVGFSFDTPAAPAAGTHTFELQTRGPVAGAVTNQEMTLTVTEQA